MASSRVRIKHKNGSYYKLRSESQIVAEEERVADAVAAAANAQLSNGHDGFRTSSRQGRKAPAGRWRTTVAAVTPYARRHNARHQTLIKALGRANG